MLLAALPFAVAPASAAQEKDIKDGRDHPLISRYTGASIVGFSETTFDEFDLPMGPTAPGGKLTKSERLRGKHTRILYVAPAQRSTLEVFTNYEQALATAGFRVLFSCAAEACGSGSLSRAVYPIENRLTQSGRNSEYAFSIPREQRYLSATSRARDRTSMSRSISPAKATPVWSACTIVPSCSSTSSSPFRWRRDVSPSTPR
jgi:OmpA-OmpF porin, OOP family